MKDRNENIKLQEGGIDKGCMCWKSVLTVLLTTITLQQRYHVDMIQHLCKVVNEMVTNLHKKQVYNFPKISLFKEDQSEF